MDGPGAMKRLPQRARGMEKALLPLPGGRNTSLPDHPGGRTFGARLPATTAGSAVATRGLARRLDASGRMLAMGGRDEVAAMLARGAAGRHAEASPHNTAY